MFSPEANPTITTAISQQKRNRSPKIICGGQRGEGGWGTVSPPASQRLLLLDGESPELHQI